MTKHLPKYKVLLFSAVFAAFSSSQALANNKCYDYHEEGECKDNNNCYWSQGGIGECTGGAHCHGIPPCAEGCMETLGEPAGCHPAYKKRQHEQRRAR